MSKPYSVESMNTQGLQVALVRSRSWLMMKWETADLDTLRTRLLRHAEILETMEARMTRTYAKDGDEQSMMMEIPFP